MPHLTDCRNLIEKQRIILDRLLHLCLSCKLKQRCWQMAVAVWILITSSSCDNHFTKHIKSSAKLVIFVLFFILLHKILGLFMTILPSYFSLRLDFTLPWSRSPLRSLMYRAFERRISDIGALFVAKLTEKSFF